MKRILFLAAMIALTLSLGCKDETPLVIEPDPIPNTTITPAKVIENFVEYFNTGDIELYKSCLSDDYTFYFNPTDVGDTVGEGYVIPESWGYEEDWQAMDNMFDFTYSVALDLPSSQIGTPPEGATEYTQSNVQITILVMTTPTDGLRAEGFVSFKFIKVNENGEDVWKIKDMLDHTTAKKGIKGASLGEIKTIFK